jgi:hypothetical protein
MSDIDINQLIESFKARLAQLEYDLIISQTLLNQANEKLKKYEEKATTDVMETKEDHG